MGITGLIPFLEKASRKINIKELRGCTVAIDTYCWLHKGAFACAEKLSRGEDTDIYIQYCLKYVNLLLSYDIKPILVFDGRHLPAKALTEKRRRESRDASKKRAAELLRLGRYDEARTYLRRCVDITHEMALKLIKECRKKNVDCIVAPYEADAQMAYLNKLDIATYIITEDSDLVLFGCQQILFKLELTGNCLLVEASKLHLAMGCRPEKFTFDKFRIMCILSGCDYLDSLPGIGLAKACKFVLKSEETDRTKLLQKIPQYLNMRQLTVSEDYIREFCIAEATFMHMYVYDPLKRTMVRLTDPSETGTDINLCSNAGSILNDETAFNLALGNLDPFTLKKLDNWNPDRDKLLRGNSKKQSGIAKHKSIWDNNFKKHSPLKRTNETISCAFHFKKFNLSNSIDFAEETIEENHSTETEILSMYTESDDLPPRKRHCKNEYSPSKHVDVYKIHKSPIKNRHNPFAKTHTENSPKKPNESISLLKAISPRKHNKLSLSNRIENGNCYNPKHILSVEQKQIKSRFFLSNIALVQKTESIESAPTVEDKGNTPEEEEIDSSSDTVSEIKLSLEKIENVSDVLYKSVNHEDHEDNKIDITFDSGKDKMFVSSNTKSIDSGINSMEQSNQTNLLNQFEYKKSQVSDVSIEINVEKSQELIIISDNDDSYANSSSKTLRGRVKKTRQVGLSKHKVKESTTQSRLSMFGFQKKPSLK